MILQITLRFLDNHYHGRTDGGAPEWPPSPFRVFQAILAGAKPHWSNHLASAFCWLERLSPPSIQAADVRRTRGVLTYVPTNNADAGDVARTEKLIQPIAMTPEGRLVGYFWTYEETQPNALEFAEAIAKCSSHIRSVGWGIDMAIGHGKHGLQSIPDPAPGYRVHTAARASNSSGNPLRVPCPGSLESLEKAYERFIDRIRTNPETGRQEIHDQPGGIEFQTRMYGSSPGRPFCAFELRRNDEDGKTASTSPRNIKALVGMIRHLFDSKRIRDVIGSDKVDQMLLGHQPDNEGPRISIMPLLSIGHRHAGGRVARVILAEPFDSDGATCHLLEEELNRKPLKPVNQDATTQLIRLPRNDPFISRWYLRESHQWASVSPVLLPGFDQRNGGKNSGVKSLERAEKLVLKSLHQAGITLPCLVEVSSISWWPGVPHARDFVPRDKLGPAPRYHVKLTFDQPFRGPLSVGRQRHMGLGVFAALDSGES